MPYDQTPVSTAPTPASILYAKIEEEKRKEELYLQKVCRLIEKNKLLSATRSSMH
jgi:hypothetical protein